MERQVMITNHQLLALVVISTVGASSLYAPAALAHYAERDSWYLILMGGIIGLFNIFVFVWLDRLFPGKNIISISISLLGRWIGSMVAALIIFYFMDVSTWTLREFAEFFIIALDPTTQQIWYMIACVIMCSYGVFHGLEVFARVSEIIFIVILFTFLGIYLLLVNQYHPEYLLPILENGLIQPLKGLLLAVSWFGDLMFISMILKHVRKTPQTPFYAAGAVGLITCVLLMSVMACTLLFGWRTTSAFTYPSISLIQNIRLFTNIERFDAVLIVVWVMSSFIKITAYFWSALRGLTDLLRLQHPHMFIVPMAIIFVICSKYKVWGLIELASLYDKKAWYFVTFQLFIPTLLLVIALVKKKSLKAGEPHKS
ncbi:spore germination protein KB [Paenibacillus sp. 1_12]|uniref:GerAB/ArcD/ProY family transporter n=1 Tax=Paenibacillus sp. 1_12 TaxID=1566278 RepID=UPI0008E5BE99|nr:endospore germination permease [Paenibacillus sp. 1_12]SFK95973.1 spore germination protein KB [Paenibacillus sp. 1_12]